MARRARNGLDDALELWSRWCYPDSPASAGRSMLAKLIDNKGELLFGGSGGSSGPADGIESRIESVVLTMFSADPLRADVLRLEYGAGWWEVASRRRIARYDWRAGQFENAEALGISLRTYRRRLAEARQMIQDHLGAV